MGKNKLRRFEENATFALLHQPPFETVFHHDYPLKGHWRTPVRSGQWAVGSSDKRTKASALPTANCQLPTGAHCPLPTANCLLPTAISQRYRYNPSLDYPTYMVPGILVLLVAIIGLFLSSMNMVREKECGTIEQLNVTPIKKYQLIIGKFFPFWVFALFDATVGLLLARWVYGIPIVGSVALVYLLLVVFLLAVLGVGLFFSAISATQQQAMFMAWFFVMVMVLLSGIFTPVESMPHWAQRFNLINPFAYGIRAVRMIMLKGSTFADVQREFYALLAYAAAALSLAINRYKKTASA